MVDINTIYDKAEQAGACNERGLSLVRTAKDIQSLIELLKSPQGIEFCMKSNFPDDDLLKKYQSELEAADVFVSGNHKLKNPRLVIAFGGSVSIQLDGHEVCEIYAKSKAFISIEAKDSSYVSAESHHGATVTYRVTDQAKVNVFDYAR